VKKNKISSKKIFVDIRHETKMNLRNVESCKYEEKYFIIMKITTAFDRNIFIVKNHQFCTESEKTLDLILIKESRHHYLRDTFWMMINHDDKCRKQLILKMHTN
jgi:hypothetical protein